MIIKTENINPKISFLTTNGIKTPKEIWVDTETKFRNITKKGIQIHIDRLKRLGITPDMTDEEVIEKAKEYKSLFQSIK